MPASRHHPLIKCANRFYVDSDWCFWSSMFLSMLMCTVCPTQLTSWTWYFVFHTAFRDISIEGFKDGKTIFQLFQCEKSSGMEHFVTF